MWTFHQWKENKVTDSAAIYRGLLFISAENRGPNLFETIGNKKKTTQALKRDFASTTAAPVWHGHSNYVQVRFLSSYK